MMQKVYPDLQLLGAAYRHSKNDPRKGLKKIGEDIPKANSFDAEEL